MIIGKRRLRPLHGAMAIALVALVLSGCGGDGTVPPASQTPPVSAPSPSPTPTPTSILGVAESDPPFQLSASSALFFEDIEYGGAERQQLDLFIPDTQAPSSLVIFYHGGGFEAGDKSDAYVEEGFRGFIDALLDRGIGFASVNYRFLTSPGAENVETSILDAQRALQFLRANADEALIIPERIVLIGGSAGSGAALFIGLGDDRADAAATDPVLRQSTRVKGVFGIVPQVGYDFANWDETVFARFADDGFDEAAIIALLGEDFALRFYGIDDLSQIDSAEIASLRRRLDFLALLSGDDPELYLESGELDGIPQSFDQLTHHPRHVEELALRAQEVGVAVRARAPEIALDTTNGEEVFDWILRVIEE